MACGESLRNPKVLWQHPDIANTQIYCFKQKVERKRRLNLPAYHDLYEYSITRRADFWQDAWEDFGLIHEGNYNTVVDESARIDSVPSWFHGVSLNFAENILYSASASNPSVRSTDRKSPSSVAVVEVREGLSSVRSVTWAELRLRTSLFASAMRAHGVKKGDRIAIVAGNSIDTLCVFLGVTSLGGLFSSSSIDMGVKGILDRLLQIRPKWVFFDDAGVYNGKTTDLRTKMKEILSVMAEVNEFRGLVSVPRFEKAKDVSGLAGAITLEEFLRAGRQGEMSFERVGFGEGFLLVYSSGTTGMPKCILHSTGGVLMAAMKEWKLHRELKETSVVMQFTTTGWIMYLTSVTTLLFGSRLIMYDGSPFHPRTDTLLRLAAQQRVTHLGISPRFLSAIQTACPQITAKALPGLSSLEVVISSGMVLPMSLFKFFYSSISPFPSHAQLANISGGTDLAGAFCDGTPLLPIFETGGCQCRGLGIDVRIYDSNLEGGKGILGRDVEVGEAGELVATKAFPNMPIGFWGDENNKKYFASYFERFDNVWTHGDFISIDPVTKSIIFHGRADGVLNPSGVRFGSAEIYSVIDAFFAKHVVDSICVGRRRAGDVDESVMLFLLMQDRAQLTQSLVKEIKDTIAKTLSRRHVPKFIFQTPAIPTTVNLKKVELPVKQIVSGKIVKPSGTLLNPESLDYYYRFAKVEEETGERKRQSRL